MTPDGFHVIDGVRGDDDPDQPEEDVLVALAEVIAGQEGASDPDVGDRAHQLAADILDMNGEARQEQSGDGAPPGSD